MARILFVYQSNTPWVEFDRAGLSREHEVIDYEFPLSRKGRKRDLRGVIRRALRMKKAMRDVDAVFVWFGDLPATAAVFWARRLKKRSIIVAGGYDGAYLEGTKYGLQQRFPRRIFPRYAFNRADLVLTVSDKLHADMLKFTKPKNAVRVYNGVETSNYTPGAKERKVLTVGGIDETTIWRKGLETFVRSAEHLPDVPFILVGGARSDAADKLREITPDNVTLTGYIPFEELLRHFQTSKVYVQVSAYESFGYSLAEAMLCECIPVVTDRGALPEVAGGTGIIAPYGDPEATAKAIEKALGSDDGPKAREHVLHTFPLEKRTERILSEIDKIL
jgi:glycosyltransferase involved in cell wall biosynthesis